VKKSVVFAICTLVPILAPVSWAHDRDDHDRDSHHRDAVVVRPFAAVEFAKLPSGVKFPEGITANPYNGDIYVGTFDGGGDNKLLRYDRRGRLIGVRSFGPTPLLGLAFNRKDHKVYICNAGSLATGMTADAKIQRINANFDMSDSATIEDVAIVPKLASPPPTRIEDNPDGSMDTITFGNNLQAPNAITFNKHGDLLFSDSFQGAIFKIDSADNCTSCPVSTVVQDGLLATAGFPPFGANGLALSKDESILFVANTGDDTVLKVDLPSGTVNGEPFAQSINGADGLTRDHHGNLWVAANQADNIVALDRNGRLLAQLGAFNGIRPNGTPNGLLFPASLVIVGDDIFVTNLALPLTGTPDDEWEEEVTRYTVSRIRIPSSLR
jgi:DNA-binding beta-propeller fold protein YncE